MKTLTRIIAAFVLACTVNIGLFAQNTSCQAAFTYTVGSGGQTSFTDASVGTTTNTACSWWWWGAGGYGNSSAPNPTFNFTYNGSYYVSLSITDSSGWCQSSVTDTIVISNGQPCQVSFTYTVGANGQVNFTNTSVGNINYYWSFGDGNYTSVTSPSNTYLYNGTYTVTLSSDTTGGYCYGWSQAVIVISNAAPCNMTAAFTTSSNGNGVFVFTDTTSANPSTSMSTWYVNGNYAGYGNPFTYAFNSNGAFTVCEVVQDSMAFNGGSGCADSMCTSVTVSGMTCTDSAYFYLYPDSSNFNGGTGAWDAWLYSSNYNGLVNAVWSWGDGTSSTGLYPTHTYSSPGWYNICVTAYFACGDSSTYCESDSLYRSNAQMVTVNVINAANAIHTNPTTMTSLKAYPNPFNEELTVSLTSYENKDITCTLYDMMGNEIQKENVMLIKGDNLFRMKTANLEKGVYFISVSSGNGKSGTIKVVK